MTAPKPSAIEIAVEALTHCKRWFCSTPSTMADYIDGALARIAELRKAEEEK